MFSANYFFLGASISILWLYFGLAESCGCKNYQVVFKYFKNCDEPRSQTVEILNLTLSVQDCKFIPRGCFRLMRAIPPGKIVYSLSKPPFKITGTDDLCQFLKDEDVQKALETYDESLPRKCIVQKGEYCVTMGYTSIRHISETTFNRLLGESTGYFKTTDACVQFKIEISRFDDKNTSGNNGNPVN